MFLSLGGRCAGAGVDVEGAGRRGVRGSRHPRRVSRGGVAGSDGDGFFRGGMAVPLLMC